MKQLLAFLVFVLVFTSCSIERRHYLPGYHVEWRSAMGEVRRVMGDGRSAKDEVQCETDGDNVIAGANDEIHGLQKASFETAVISAEQYPSLHIDAPCP